MTILCATDFSDSSWEAAQAAAAIAARTRDKVELVYVMPEHFSGVEQPLKAVRLDEDAERLADQFDVHVQARVLRGEPARELAFLAEQLDVKLVVLSSRGASRHDHWIHPSVAENVARTVKIPTLVVRDSLHLRQWAAGERALSVMIGVGFDVSSRAALSWVTKLRELAPCDVLLSEIVWPFAERRRLGLEAGVDPERLEAEVAAIHEQALEAWAGTLSGAGAVRFEARPGWGRIDTHLTQRAAAEGVDLLVVGSHGRSGLDRLVSGSISSGTVRYASCNVACVPAPAAALDLAEIHGFHNVLVPVDFSQLSRRAIAHAYGLMRPGGIAHLVHVLRVGEGAAHDETLAALERLVPPGARARGIETRAYVPVDESPSTAILQAAERLGVDAICMATRGRATLAEAVLGSEAQRVLKAAHCPVMLVGPVAESRS